MQHDLIVLASTGEWEAQRIRDALLAMRKSPLLGVSHAVMASKDNACRVTVLHWRDLSSGSDRKGTRVLDRLTELIFGEPSPDDLDRLATTGLDIQFLSLIGQRMQGNTSALFFLLGGEGLEDADELLATLSLFRGRTYQTTLSEETIAALVEPTPVSSPSGINDQRV